MTTVIVLFNLKADVVADAYEQWARATDLPTVNKLGSVIQFSVLKSLGLLGGGSAPYQYIEILELRSLEQLGADIRSETMQKVAAEFREFADAPLFIVTESIS